MKRFAYFLFSSVLAGFFLSSGIRAQGPSVAIQPDIRVFSIMAALYTAGWDPGNLKPSVARTSILQDLKDVSPELKARLGKFYQEHTNGQKPEELLSRYISLSLLCEGPPDFKLPQGLDGLPPAVKPLAEFMDLVKELYTTAKLEVVWSANREFYELAIATYRPLIEQIILRTDGYLRIASGSYLDRRLLIIPEYLVPPNSFDARTYREIYYLVFGPSEKPAVDELRHQYLHFLLDPYASRFPLPRETQIALAQAVEKAPDIQEQYRIDLQFLVIESLIRAIELRLNRIPEPKLTAELDASLRSGALLTRHFYTSLTFFEPSPEGIRIFYPGMVKGIHVDMVEAQFADAQKTAVVKKPEPTALQLQLKAANEQLADGSLDNAAQQFRKILESLDANNGEALYGLGVVAVMQNKRNEARDFFENALKSPSSDAGTKAWCHIYLARMDDLEQNRPEAIEHYQAVVTLGDNTRNALEIAQKGLKEPFAPKSSR
ncbi:MAG: hypothetical protein U0V70_04910 [Terriglobia bacterium]